MLAPAFRVAEVLDRLAPAILPSLARLVFAGTLLVYFWASARTKIGSGLFTPEFGAYAQIFPRAFEAVGYDPSQLGAFHWGVVLAGTWAEFLLPALIVIGLLTRLAALGMIGFIVVQSLTDIVGHHADAATLGAWFDRASGALIADQRAFWILVLLVPVFIGPGPASIDRLIFRR